MFGLMQDRPLMISSIIRYAARNHTASDIVSKNVDGSIHRYRYPDLESRARRLVRVLQALGIKPADRVATLGWNGFRHMELYYGISGMQAICHTINPRLGAPDVGFIVNDAADSIIFAETSFAALIDAIAPDITRSVRAVVFLCDRAEMPTLALPAGMALLCYEDLMEAATDEYVWPEFDERTAAALCYTSGTTGKPKGVLYSHRSTVIHAMAIAAPDVFGLRATDRVLPVVPMFHVNAWGLPYAAPATGASLIMPGRHLDGLSLTTLMNDERVTMSAGVPTVWLGLLQHLRSSGARLETVNRLVIGGSACPRLLLEAFEREYGVRVDHAWGMSETSPLGTMNAPLPSTIGLQGDAKLRHLEKQGRGIFGIDMKIVDDSGAELPWDGVAQGNLVVRGVWVASAYWGQEPGSACDEHGWFATGDVATIDADGTMEITDRSKDVIKSGGEWISSITLENIAVSHPDVAEAAIVAASHPKWTERPLLVVVPRPGRTLDPAEVLTIYDGKIPKWWLPDGVVVVDELPHTATGKVHKLTLRNRFRDHLTTP
jgi:acyl-CoA synthetase (AMP-forming)/AMP-acid ligase II